MILVKKLSTETIRMLIDSVDSRFLHVWYMIDSVDSTGRTPCANFMRELKCLIFLKEILFHLGNEQRPS